MMMWLYDAYISSNLLIYFRYKIIQVDMLGVRVVGKRRSERTKPSQFKGVSSSIPLNVPDMNVRRKCLRRNISSDEMIHDHQLEEQLDEEVAHDHSPTSNKNNHTPLRVGAVTEHHIEVVAQHNPIPIPTLDSPATRTRLARRRQIETSNENDIINERPTETTTLPKRTRGPTKMKTIAVDKQSRVDVAFNEYGQPIGDTSVGLASFLGPLVREVVPVNLEEWKKLPTRLKVVLWKSIQV